MSFLNINLDNFILNQETDGDGIYHIHHKECKKAPESNYIKLSNIKDKHDLNKYKKRTFCAACLSNKEKKDIESCFLLLQLN